jgi:fatty-acyl-CoA synthase
MFDRLLAAAGGGDPFRTLRLCGYAAFNAALGALPRKACDAGLPLVGLYGMSEVHALFARREPADPAPLRTTPGGRPVNPAARVRVVDEAGAPVSEGVSGALEIASPTTFAEYLGNPEATAEAITGDGYFRTGDVGRLTEDGGFAFEARDGDVLRLGGFLVNPKEIEAVIEALDAVSGAQVVGVDTPGGARPVAFVTLAEGARFSESAVGNACARQLARFKVPARVVALDAFPVTEGANGTKIQRQKLRAMAATLLSETATSATRRT